MGNLGFILLAVALAPFFFFPTIAAFTGRKRTTPVFAVANLLLAAWLFYFLRSMGDSSAPRIPLPGGALLWRCRSHLLRGDRSSICTSSNAAAVTGPTTLRCAISRRDAAARERYTAGKQAALAGAGNRLLAYSAAKQPLIEELLAQAKTP